MELPGIHCGMACPLLACDTQSVSIDIAVMLLRNFPQNWMAEQQRPQAESVSNPRRETAGMSGLDHSLRHAPTPRSL